MFTKDGRHVSLSIAADVNLLNRPEHVRCLMGYVVDLTLVLQAVFQVSLQDRTEGKVTADSVNEIIYEFHFSEKKKRIHNAIRAFQPSFTKGDVVEKIESLIKDNEVSHLQQLNGYKYIFLCR